MTKDTIYLDNAATTWPKPDEVYRAVDMAMREHEPTRAAARTECRSTRNAWSTRPGKRSAAYSMRRRPNVSFLR